jgi:hypothetical protein
MPSGASRLFWSGSAWQSVCSRDASRNAGELPHQLAITFTIKMRTIKKRTPRQPKESTPECPGQQGIKSSTLLGFAIPPRIAGRARSPPPRICGFPAQLPPSLPHRSDIFDRPASASARGVCFAAHVSLAAIGVDTAARSKRNRSRSSSHAARGFWSWSSLMLVQHRDCLLACRARPFHLYGE